MSFIADTTTKFHEQIAGFEGANRSIRESAWEAFIAAGLPTRRVENWRYTNLRLLDQMANHQEAADACIDTILNALPNDFYRVVLIDGQLRSDLSQFEVKWVETAVSAKIDPVKHPLAVLNLAMSQGGVELNVPAGTVIDKPILLLQLNTKTSHGHTHYFNHRIILGEGARASLITQTINTPGLSCANNILVLVQQSEHSQLRYYSMNASQSDAIHIEGVHSEQQADSSLDMFVLSTGSLVSRVDLNAVYLGSRASSRTYGIYSVNDKQHTDIHLNAEHVASHCSTVQSVRGVVDGAAKAVFNGRVCVHQHAVKSFSQQANHNLMLSKMAQVYTKPELEIYNDDVKCSHGATVGQLDQDALFYLMARGISEQDALTLLREAFVAQQFDFIQDESIKKYFMGISS